MSDLLAEMDIAQCADCVRMQFSPFSIKSRRLLSFSNRRFYAGGHAIFGDACTWQ